MTSLAIFGAGRIGGGVAAMVSALGLADRIVLYDTNKALLEAQRLDLIHARTQVTISTRLQDIGSSDIVICTAGLPRNPAVKTRAHLLDVNLPAATDCARALKGFSGILISITNPADVITYYLWKATGASRKRVIGFGGQLDSARFSCELSYRGIQEDGTILGEHGEFQVPVFSRLSKSLPYEERNTILTSLRGASMEIIKGKGATEYAPVWHISRLIKAIINDERITIPCSSILDGEFGYSDCSLGVPVKIGKEGIYQIEEWELDPWEKEQMDAAASNTMELCRRLPDATYL